MSALLTKTSISLLAGVAGTLFLGYCIYFDRKRRSDPEFRKKLRESKLANPAARVSPSIEFYEYRNCYSLLFFFREEDPKN